MAQIYEEKISNNANFSMLGIKILIPSVADQYIPVHWHNRVEILYCLNGEMEVFLDKKRYTLKPKQLIVIDSGKVHGIRALNDVFMFMMIQLSKKNLMTYVPDIDLFQIDCTPLKIDHPKFDQYIHLCQLAEELTRININAVAPTMRSDALTLLLFTEILENFSVLLTPDQKNLPAASVENIYTVLSYVTEHFREPLTLQEMADLLGFTKEYFCHYFKKYMGVSFLTYLSRVRISNAYNELLRTDTPVSEIMEHNGITNQKVFNRIFKEIYGCTPRDARKNRKFDI